MKEPLTDELLQELLDAPDPRAFAERHRIGRRSLPDYLQQLLDEKGLEQMCIRDSIEGRCHGRSSPIRRRGRR